MGRIFAIKKYAIHDGPNIRTTVFLKGCPLACHWCHNPEGLNRKIEIVWVAGKCIGCGECIEQCPAGALRKTEDGMNRDMALCDGCGTCVDCCPALAHDATGREVSVDEVIAEIEKDLPFYDQTGGGVTFSGGEPLSQPDFLMDLLDRCGQLGIHRTIDTSAFVKAENLLMAAEKAELILVDLKHMQNDLHKKFTGVGNERILENIRRLDAAGRRMILRIPLVKGVNDGEENLKRSAEFIGSLTHVERVDLLPYHSIAGAEYRKLGIRNLGENFHEMSREEVQKCSDYLTEKGLKVQVGG